MTLRHEPKDGNHNGKGITHQDEGSDTESNDRLFLILNRGETEKFVISKGIRKMWLGYTANQGVLTDCRRIERTMGRKGGTTRARGFDGG